MEMNTALIVFAHESKDSFSAAAKNEAETELKGQGLEVLVSDLHAMKFKLTATAKDIVGYTQEEVFDYADATEEAWRNGKLAKEITDEQSKLKKADLVIFQFPLYWFSAPAIVKGWIDRVLTRGFAYADEKGLLNNKRVLISFTTGSQESMFRARSIDGKLKFNFLPVLHKAMSYCGFEVLDHQEFQAPSSANEEERKRMLERWVKRLQNIKNETASTPPMPDLCPEMKVLIVYAHQSSNSFNASIKNKTKETLELKGCKVEVSDLYSLVSKEPAKDVAGDTQTEDSEKPLDIPTEQRKLKEADLVIFQFPLYWFSVPAILKDWIDKVLIKGFAYTDEKCFAKGLFGDTKALLSFTTGTQASMFKAQDPNGDFDYTLCPILQGTLTYCGFRILKPQIFWAPACGSKEACEKMLATWEERLKDIANEKAAEPLKHEISQNTSESGASKESPEDRKKSGV